MDTISSHQISPGSASPEIPRVISNFAPPNFRKVKPPEIGKVKPPNVKNIKLGTRKCIIKGKNSLLL